MSNESTEQRVARLLSGMLGLPVERFTPETDLVQDLGISSVDLLGLVAALEDEFEIIFPADGSLVGNVRTVGELVALVEEFAEE